MMTRKRRSRKERRRKRRGKTVDILLTTTIMNILKGRVGLIFNLQSKYVYNSHFEELRRRRRRERRRKKNSKTTTTTKETAKTDTVFH